MRKLKTSQLHVIILIFSLMPFILGMTYSILKSEEKSYLSAAINIAGSERMRTMLIANYSQQLVYKADQRDEVLAILNDEIDRYLVFSNALAYGDVTIGLKANPFEDIKFTAILAKEKANELAFNVRELIQNPQDHNRLTYITENALAIKDTFHDLTERYQKQNDALIKRQMTIDTTMIALGIIITIIGLTYTSKIKNQEHYSKYDFLTELNNRHSFAEFMQSHPHDQYTVFFIDLNKFKPVNDCFGHEVGDQVLVSVSRILRDIFGEALIFRYGGDEFVGLVKIDKRYKVDNKLRNLGSNPTDGKIYHVISTIRMEMAKPIIDHTDTTHLIGISMGVVRGDLGFENWQDLITFADHLMYDSKLVSSNVVTCLNVEEFQSRMNLMMDLTETVSGKNVVPEIIPYHRMGDEAPVLLMLLARWRRFEQVISTAHLLSQIKKSGKLTEFDKYMVTQAFLYVDETPIIVTVTEETMRKALFNGFMALLESNRSSCHQIYLKFKFETLFDIEAYQNILTAKGFGYRIAVDSISVDFALQDYDKYQMIDLFKIDHELFEVILKDTHLALLFKQHLHMISQADKIVIFDGLSERDESLFRMFELPMERMLFSKMNKK